MPLDDTRRVTTATEIAAMEYYTAATKAREGAAEKEKAHKACVAAGVLPDHAAHPFPAGTTETVYDGREVRIVLKVVNPISKTQLDGPAFIAALLRAKVKPALIARLEKLHTHTVATAPAHTFTASLVG